jgi:hypothetical protein
MGAGVSAGEHADIARSNRQVARKILLLILKSLYIKLQTAITRNFHGSHDGRESDHLKLAKVVFTL